MKSLLSMVLVLLRRGGGFSQEPSWITLEMAADWLITSVGSMETIKKRTRFVRARPLRIKLQRLEDQLHHQLHVEGFAGAQSRGAVEVANGIADAGEIRIIAAGRGQGGGG